MNRFIVTILLIISNINCVKRWITINTTKILLTRGITFLKTEIRLDKILSKMNSSFKPIKTSQINFNKTKASKLLIKTNQ
jgi:hypothetical protein